MSELLKVNRETPHEASELANRLVQNNSQFRAVVQGSDVIIHIDNPLVNQLYKLIAGVVTVCERVSNAVLVRDVAHNNRTVVEADADASNNDDHSPEMDKAA